MLARHHAVEAVLDRERGLRAELVDDLRRRKVEMRIAPQRNRAGRERRGAGGHRVLSLAGSTRSGKAAGL